MIAVIKFEHADYGLLINLILPTPDIDKRALSKFGPDGEVLHTV